jgi:hypothetical protein
MKKIWPNLQRIVELFTQIVIKLSKKYRFGILNPEKNPILVRVQNGTGFRIRNTAYQQSQCIVFFSMFWIRK